MEGTLLQQGRFTSTGALKRLVLRSDVDWIKVYNHTTIATPANTGLEFYWQRGMTDGAGYIFKGSAGANTVQLTNLTSPNGFKLIDTSEFPIGASVATTALTAVVQPVVSTATVVPTGSVIRLFRQLVTPNYLNAICMMDVQVTSAPGALTFAYALANAPANPATTGSYRLVKYDPIYYPRIRYIIAVTSNANGTTTVRCSCDHGLTVGQKVRLTLPAAYGMIQLDGLSGTIISLNATLNEMILDIDSTAFTAFVFPDLMIANTPAIVTPIGEDTAKAVALGANVLADATYNGAYIGIELAGGADSPAGDTNDIMYWVAGKSWNVDNT